MTTNAQDAQTKKQATDDVLNADTENRAIETAALVDGRHELTALQYAALRGGRGPATASTAEKIGRSYGMLDAMNVTARDGGKGTLNVALPNNATTVDVVLNSGEGDNFPATSGPIELVIGTERLIAQNGRTGDTFPNALRAQHGSSAAAHAQNAVVTMPHGTARHTATVGGRNV